MNQDINKDMAIENLLEEDSEFIENLCEQLELEGIHLTPKLLSKIISIYEKEKVNLFKGFFEELMEHEGIQLDGEGGPAVIQVVVDNQGKSREKDQDPLSDMDSKLLS